MAAGIWGAFFPAFGRRWQRRKDEKREKAAADYIREEGGIILETGARMTPAPAEAKKKAPQNMFAGP